MQIQINTANNVDGREARVSGVEAEIRAGLSRFDGRLTRVEVHIGDEANIRQGGADTRCMMEARPQGLGPMTVTDHAATPDLAVSGALRKMTTALDREFGKLDSHRGH
ncbi:MAG: ribosomal subunit interface protein [Brevundimonas sp.]